jgi:hypothetical protein
MAKRIRLDKSVLAFSVPLRIRSEAHRRFVASLPCCICAAAPTQTAHIRSNGEGGMGLKPCDRLTIPLCPPCHFRQHHTSEAEVLGDIDKAKQLALSLFANTGDGLIGLQLVSRFGSTDSLSRHAAYGRHLRTGDAGNRRTSGPVSALALPRDREAAGLFAICPTPPPRNCEAAGVPLTCQEKASPMKNQDFAHVVNPDTRDFLSAEPRSIACARHYAADAFKHASIDMADPDIDPSRMDLAERAMRFAEAGRPRAAQAAIQRFWSI